MYDYYELEDNKMQSNFRDWRKALRTPATYRVGNTVRVQPQFIFLIMIIGVCLSFFFYYNWCTSNLDPKYKWIRPTRPYNSSYPLSSPYRASGSISYRIGIVADLDTNSKSNQKPHTFNSYLKKGFLTYDPVLEEVSVLWDTKPTMVLSSTYSHKGRGMELSELIVYDGRLLTFDDRSGMIFEIIKNKIVPWVILSDGNGHNEKGFKIEWATIKDQILYVGSMGKEWTTAGGEFESYDPMWIKAVNIHGEVKHINWVREFKAIRSSIGIQWPGYMIHESGVWSHITQKWHFLPRRCSHEAYNETRDEVMGCNYLITTDQNFMKVQAKEITKHDPKLGFSSFKFIPETNDEAIVALKTTEFEGKTATYITVFKTDGKLLLEDLFIENLKYEGIEFI